MLKIDKIADIRYRITNLREDIRIIVDDESEHERDSWDCGYHEGRLVSLESELHFLEGLVKHDGQDIHI